MAGTNILRQAKTFESQIINWRRHLHSIPEIGMETPETEKFVAGELRKLGLEVQTGIGGHGVSALLRGAKPGRTLGIRSDMDALQIEEKTNLPFASSHPGRMHACGHDAHMAITLGAAAILSGQKKSIRGNVKFIFQPAEETAGGAKPMISDGVLKHPKVDGVIGLHIGNIWKQIPCGHIGYLPGTMMACQDRFDILLKGKGGHGAIPHQAVDSIAIACQVVSALQTIVSREINPCESAVLSVCKIEGGSAHNIIPGEVLLQGTCRSFSDEMRKFMADRIESIVHGVVAGMRGKARINYTFGFPPVRNDPAFTHLFAKSAASVIGSNKVHLLTEPTMGGEDFAFFLEKAPGTYFFLAGCNPSRGQTAQHHNSKFDIDERVLSTGSALLSNFARQWLPD